MKDVNIKNDGEEFFRCKNQIPAQAYLLKKYYHIIGKVWYNKSIKLER